MTQDHPAPPLTVSAALTAYLDWHALRGSTVRHRKETRRILLAFSALVQADQPVSAVAREDCVAFLRAVQERGSKPNTQNAYYRTPVAFFRWLCQAKYLTG
jgi:hypothetical protein